MWLDPLSPKEVLVVAVGRVVRKLTKTPQRRLLKWRSWYANNGQKRYWKDVERSRRLQREKVARRRDHYRRLGAARMRRFRARLTKIRQGGKVGG